VAKQKKQKKQKRPEFKSVVSNVTQPHLESYLYGFLQSRGYDLYPRVKPVEGGFALALYFDCGEDGWRRVILLEMADQAPVEEIWFALGVALVNHVSRT
jgi:hypothetical protein